MNSLSIKTNNYKTELSIKEETEENVYNEFTEENQENTDTRINNVRIKDVQDFIKNTLESNSSSSEEKSREVEKKRKE